MLACQSQARYWNRNKAFCSIIKEKKYVSMITFLRARVPFFITSIHNSLCKHAWYVFALGITQEHKEMREAARDCQI